MKSTRAGFRRSHINYGCGIIKQSRCRTSNELTRNGQQRQSKFTFAAYAYTRYTLAFTTNFRPTAGSRDLGERTFSNFVSPCRAFASEAARCDFEQRGFSACLPLRFQPRLVIGQVIFPESVIYCVISDVKIPPSSSS